MKPNEIYNLGAQSHVGVSFENPVYTAEVTGLGSLRILEALRFLRLDKVKFYQATSSELFGEKVINKFNEKSELNPKSPYGVSKLFAHHITKVYRDSIIFLPAVVFYLIMKVQEEEKHLLPERLLCFWLNVY